MRPKVTVIIPTYNRAHFIKSAIDSVLNQTFGDFELIVIDDGSSDGTDKLLNGYGDKLRYIQQRRQEKSAARNKGIELAQGEYIAFLDSDDVWFSNKLSRQVPVLDSAPKNVVLVHGYKQVVNKALKPLPGYEKRLRRSYSLAEKRKETYESYLKAPCIFTSTTLVRCQTLLEAGGYDTNIKDREDHELYLRLLLKGHEFTFLSEPPLIQYRLDENRTDQRRMDIGYLYLYEKHLSLCDQLQEKKKIARAQRLLYQNIAQTHYRLGNFTQAYTCWNKALKKSLLTLADIHFWKQGLVNLYKNSYGKRRAVEF